MATESYEEHTRTLHGLEDKGRSISSLFIKRGSKSRKRSRRLHAKNFVVYNRRASAELGSMSLSCAKLCGFDGDCFKNGDFVGLR